MRERVIVRKETRVEQETVTEAPAGPQADYEYEPEPDGRACGLCDSCLLRQKGFAAARRSGSGRPSSSSRSSSS